MFKIIETFGDDVSVFKRKTFVVKLFCFVTARENRELDILIFREVMDNIARVDRVLTRPGGSLLLAGRSGVGRRTAVTLVTHMHNVTVVTPKVSRGYGLKQFKNDLKSVSTVLLLCFKNLLAHAILGFKITTVIILQVFSQ